MIVPPNMGTTCLRNVEFKTPACFVLVTNFLLQGANLLLLNFASLMIGQGNNNSLLSTPIRFNNTT